MDFGLGLVLSFTDNASAGMNGAVQSLNNLTSIAEEASSSISGLNSTASLMATSMASNMIGDSLIKSGSSILSLFGKLMTKTQQLGSEYEDFGITLGALGMDTGKAINKLFEFANKSPLEVGDVKNMIVTLQAQGINAFEKTKGSISGVRQEFLAYLTDLKSFRPEVLGQRFNMAIQNYIGSGEKKMMRTVFDMGDIEDIIGHDVSKTAEGRMNDIVEMVEKKGLTGLSAKMSTTWSGVASNIDDAFTRIYYSVANDGGVFKKLKKSFMDLAQVIIKLPNDKLASLGKTIGSALDVIVSPLTRVAKLATKLAKKLIDLAQTNPKLLKFGIVLTTMSGAMLVLSGVVMKLIGSFAGFVIVLDKMGGTVSAVSNMFKSGFTAMAKTVLPFVAVIGLLVSAWRTDFGGVRTLTTNFVNNVSNAFSTAKTTVDGNVSDLIVTLQRLRDEDSFWGNITIGLMKIYGTMKFVAESWNNYTLSEESFQKAEKLGILPLISRILDLKYRFEFFKKGFINGWNEVSNSVRSAIESLAPHLKGTIFEDMLNSFKEFMTAITNNDPKAWEKVGNFFGQLVAKSLLIIPVIKILTSVFGKFIALASGISKVVSFLGMLKNGVMFVLRPFRELVGLISGKALTPSSKLGQFFVDLVPKILKVVNVVKNIGSAIAGIGAGPIAVIMGAIASVVAFAVTQKDKFIGMLTTIKDTFTSVFSGVIERVKQIASTVIGLVQPAIDFMTSAFGDIKGAIGGINPDAFSPLISILSTIGEIIMGSIVPTINFIINVIGGAIKGIVDIIGGVLAGVITIVTTVIGGVINAISGVINFIKGAFNTVAGVITGLITGDFSYFFDGIKQMGSGIAQFFKGVFGAITGILAGIGEVLTGIVGGFIDFGGSIIQGLIQGIQQYVGNIVTAVTDFGSKIIDTFCDIFGIHSPSRLFMDFGINIVKGLIKGIKSIVHTVLTPFRAIVSGVKKVFTKLPDFFSDIWTKIKTTASNLIGGIKKGIVDKFTGIKDTVKKGLDTVKGFFNKCKIKLPEIKTPHFKISGGKAPYGIAGKGTAPKVDLQWYAKGGVFDKPDVIGVGEDGKEAVMPLEKNLGWIDELSSKISSRITGSSKASSEVITRKVENNTSTSNNRTNNSYGNVDNSIHFESGSIVIQAKDMSTAEAEKFAKMIMQRIKRQREIDGMLQYQG